MIWFIWLVQEIKLQNNKLSNFGKQNVQRTKFWGPDGGHLTKLFVNSFIFVSKQRMIKLDNKRAVLFNMDIFRPLFLLFSSFPHSNNKYSFNFNNINWKKHRWCAWDSNPGQQKCRHWRNHGAKEAVHKRAVFVAQLAEGLPSKPEGLGLNLCFGKFLWRTFSSLLTKC